MINQRAYPDIVLGFGSGSIASYGCFLCSILDSLNKMGYSYSVAQFNQLLKDRGAFVNGNLIDAPTLAIKVGDIFLEGRKESWNDAKVIQYLNDKENYILVGEVSAKGIGGSGQHFVKMDRVDVSNGKVMMTYIDDPWGGLEDQKVTIRYNAYGNILSLRVFKIRKVSGGNMANMYKGYDLANPESMKVAVDILVRLQSGELVEKKFKDERDLIFAKLGLESQDSIDDALFKLGELTNRPTNKDKDKAVKLAVQKAENTCEDNITYLVEKMTDDFIEKEKIAVDEAVKNARKQWEEENPTQEFEDPKNMSVGKLLMIVIDKLLGIK